MLHRRHTMPLRKYQSANVKKKNKLTSANSTHNQSVIKAFQWAKTDTVQVFGLFTMYKRGRCIQRWYLPTILYGIIPYKVLIKILPP
jgi:hypothetical protein